MPLSVAIDDLSKHPVIVASDMYMEALHSDKAFTVLDLPYYPVLSFGH